MKKIIFLTLFSVAALLAKTETVNLTGAHSEQLGNPFKRVLNTQKTKSINIYSEEKDVVLKVESDLDTGNFYTNNQHPDQLILKNESVENVVENFYNEEYAVNRSSEDAVVVNIVSGTIFLSYSNEEYSQGIQHLMGIEVKLVVSINGQEKEITMDHRLGKEAVNYKGFISTDDFDFKALNMDYSLKIIENEIYQVLKGN